MASKNPTNEIATRIALSGGYDPCLTHSTDGILWTKKVGCDPYFIPDYENGFCYILLSTKENFGDGEMICKSNFDAELLLLDTNNQAKSLIKLIETGLFI
jgi:hypothetical protein